MEKYSALYELISAVPEYILQQPCSDEHLREIGICISNWQTIAPHLSLSPANEEAIAAYKGDQRIRMLRRWQEKYGSGATYRSLADSFQKIERADLIDKIRTLLTAPEQLLPSPKRPRVEEKNPAANPGLLQASQSSHLTQPISSFLPIPVPIRHHDRTHRDAFLLTPESQTIYPISGRGIPKDSGAGNDQLESSSATVTLPRIPELEQKAEDSEETCTRTKKRIEDLEGKYMALVKKTQKEVMKQEPDLETFCTTITLLPTSLKKEHQKYLKDNLPQLYSAKSIPEIFGLLNLYWNYLHYSLLQRIIEIYGTDDTKELMKCYIKDVKSFQQETTLAMFWEAQPKETSPKLLVGEIAEVLTSHAKLTSSSLLKTVDELRQKFARTISPSEFAIVIKDILQGSVVIVWLIPAKGVITLKNQVKQGRVEFFKQHHILELRMNDDVIYSSDQGEDPQVSFGDLTSQEEPMTGQSYSDSEGSSQSSNEGAYSTTSSQSSSGRHSELHKLIRAVSKRILQQPCSDDHLREIGRCITNWQTIAPHLNLLPADEEDIATYSGDKRIKMLRRWQEKIGSGATYRSLADSFQKIDRADLIDKIRALLTDPEIFFDDVTSQEESMTEQSYDSRRSSLPAAAEGGTCRSVSPQQQEYFSKSGIKFTGTSPCDEWCCRLKYDGGAQDAASGVIVKLNCPPEKLHTHLPGLRPMKKDPEKYGSVQTSYILITCHRVIPGMSYLKGWNLDVGLGKSRSKSPLKHLVCGAVSCCGENGFISSGPLKTTEETAVFSPHLNARCLLELDFTVLFLNSAFEKLVKKGVQTEPPEINLNLKAERHQQLQLYRRERHEVVPISLRVRVQPQDSSLSTLSDEIKVHKTLQVIDYIQFDRKFAQCCPGSALVSCDPNSDEKLVGIHVKTDSDFSGSGITIYGIFQLLKGELAAFFAVMEQPSARMKWPFRWAHLLTHTLESDVVGVKEKPLSYLLDILHLLFTAKSGICLIEFRVSDPSFKLTSDLQLLTALFKQFDKYECEEIAEAISAMLTDEIMEKLQQLSKFLVNLLDYLLSCNIQSKADLVKAFFVCYNQVLKFEYKGKFQAVLSTPDVTEKLQSLRKECSKRLPPDTYNVIGMNFQDICLQLMKCKYESQIHQLEEQNEQLKAQVQKQDKSDTWQELQLTKRPKEEKNDLEEGPEQLLPSPKRPRVQEQNSAAIPGLLQAFQSSHSTQPISSYDPTFHDLTSQEETMTVQSPNRKRSLPAEEGACSSVSPPPHSREEEYSSKTGINFTGTSPYEEWCCHLIYDGGSHDAASGVIVKLNYPPEKLHTHLPGLRPMKEYPKVYGSVKTSYILITCHRVIPGKSYLKGWSLDVGLEKSILKSLLEHLVCGAVSCCGENGFISGGPLKPDEETAVFSPHQNGRCLLDLDFTILFLNPEFEKHVLSRKGVQTEPPEINLNLKTERHQQLQLYQHEQHRVVPIPLTSDRVQSRAQDSSLSTCTLSDEIKVHKTLQVIDYTQTESKLTQCCSGSPLVSCDPNSDETLVGIHVKADSDCSGSGITIYGIFQLLKGQLAAFFAAMEHADARKKWPFRWAHLLTPALESDVVGQKEKPLSYLLDILNLLLTDMSGIRLIELNVSDTSLKHKSALQLLSALFKQFDEYECEEIAEAVSGMFTDKITEKFQQLTKFLVNLLEYLLHIRCSIESKADLVKAYFVCYKQVLNFEYKGKFQAVLSTPDVTKKLQSLRKECSERLPLDTDYVIGRNFQDIWLQLMTCKYESQLKEQKIKYEFQIQQLKAQNEQLKKQKIMNELQIQELKAQLQMK